MHAFPFGWELQIYHPLTACIPSHNQFDQHVFDGNVHVCYQNVYDYTSSLCVSLFGVVWVFWIHPMNIFMIIQVLYECVF